MPGLFHMEPGVLGSDLFLCCCAQLFISPLWAGWLSTCSGQIGAPCGVCSQTVPQGGLCTQKLFCFGRILVLFYVDKQQIKECPCLGRGVWWSSVRSSRLEGFAVQSLAGNWLIFQCFSFMKAYPLDMQRIVKCWFCFEPLVWFSDTKGCTVKLRICIDSRRDRTNWAG